MTDQPKLRVHSIDILRGIVMIIMALDHTRDFFHIHAVTDSPTNLATTTPVLFFTRWITHFCAPTFVFLSGISAYLAGRNKTGRELSAFLIKRGLWLVIADATIMTFALTFNPQFNIIFMLVLWAIGLSMIILGLLVLTSPTVILITGAIIVLAHNLFDYFPLPLDKTWGLAVNLFANTSRSIVPLGANRIMVSSYAVIPWAGLMMLGYSTGQLYNPAKFTPQRRMKVLLIAGISAICLFIALRLINHYGDPAPFASQKDGILTVLSFFNVTKYPPSLDFMCMTVGPSLIVLAITENLQNRFAAFVSVYGKVPFFYFVVHFYLLHVLLAVAFFASGYRLDQASEPKVPFLFHPLQFGFSLGAVYATWVFVVLVLYKPCKWFNNYRTTHNKRWLKYL